MTVGRIVVYVFAAMLAGVTIGLLKSRPAPPPQDLAEPPRTPVVASISVKAPPSSSSPSPSPSSAPAPSSPAAVAAPRPGPELPPGAPVPARGEGWWRTVNGTTAQVGAGHVHTYTVEVEQGAVAPSAHHPFAAVVDQALADPRGWTAAGGIAFRRVDVARPDVRIRLTAPETARATCGFSLPYDTSCYANGVVYVNAARWFRGAQSFGGDLDGYRKYVINHEIGHFLGRGHEPCPADGAPAPVMMQQTFSVSNDVLAELTAAAPQGVTVPGDGRTCVPNPWPNPEVGR